MDLTRLAACGLFALALAPPAAAQDVFTGGVTISDGNAAEADLFVTDVSVLGGDVCIGDGCASTETFGSDVTLKLRDPTPSITFVDTSDPPFPDREWKLLVNEPDSGGLERFSIKDGETGNIPFTVQGNAPENALWVAYNGHLGNGTSLPQSNLHIVSGSGPSIRLEQDGTQGAAQNFEMYVAAGGFVMHDDLANTFPFRVNAGARSFALSVFDDGDIGIGPSSAAAPLHVQRDDGTARVLVENTYLSPVAVREMFKMSNNGGSYFTLDNTDSGTTWYFTHEQAPPNRFIITDGVADGPEMTLTAEGDLTIQGQLFTAGSCAAGCDRVFDAGYPLPSIAEQAAMMKTLKHLPNVGPTPEDGPFNLTQMTGGMLNELEKAHLYIAELEERDRMRTAEAERMNARIARLEALVETLAAR
ncbi:hypothetical protein [Tropicibacter sp. S64]|uniref:hypothetical protein n=1 Tax=Tropicibacter sp. S64 TaxID=3415122 RepID=UPI003C7ED303